MKVQGSSLDEITNLSLLPLVNYSTVVITQTQVHLSTSQ